MPTMNELLDKRGEILRLAAKHGAHDVRLFGSVSRGEAMPGSDVDLLVRLDEDRSLLDHIALMRDLEELLGCPVDVVSEEALYSSIRDRVVSEAVRL